MNKIEPLVTSPKVNWDKYLTAVKRIQISDDDKIFQIFVDLENSKSANVRKIIQMFCAIFANKKNRPS